MSTPTLDNPRINIVCRCGKKLSWEACRNPGAGKIQISWQCACNEQLRGHLMLDAAVERRVFAGQETTE